MLANGELPGNRDDILVDVQGCPHKMMLAHHRIRSRVRPSPPPVLNVPADRAVVYRYAQRLLLAQVAGDGTRTGEHGLFGVGIAKAAWRVSSTLTRCLRLASTDEKAVSIVPQPWFWVCW